MKRLLKCLH